MKQTKKVLKKKPVKKKISKPKIEELEEEEFNEEDWEAEVGPEEPIIKPLILNVVVDNGKVVVFQDIITGFCYALRSDLTLVLLGKEIPVQYFDEDDEEEKEE